MDGEENSFPGGNEGCGLYCARKALLGTLGMRELTPQARCARGPAGEINLLSGH